MEQSTPTRMKNFIKQSNVNEIIKNCDARLIENPRDAKVLYLRGCSMTKLGRYDDAIEDFNAAFKISPNSECVYSRGMAHSKLNRHDLAIADFTQSLKLDPNNINALFARAASFNAIGSLSRAIEDYNAAFLKDQGLSNDEIHGAKSSRLESRRRRGSMNDGNQLSDNLGFGSQPTDDSVPNSTSSSKSVQSVRNTESSDLTKSEFIRTKRVSNPALLSSGPIFAPLPSKNFSRKSSGGNSSPPVKTSNISNRSPSVGSATARLSGSNVKDSEICFTPNKASNRSSSSPRPPPPSSSSSSNARPPSSSHSNVKSSQPPFNISGINRKEQTPQQKQITELANNSTLSPSKATSRDSAIKRRSYQLDSSECSIAAEHNKIGYKYRQAGDYRNAIKEYNKALTVDPKFFRAYFNRGFAYDKLGNFEMAIFDYTKAIELDSNNAYTYYNRGISLDRLHRFSEAYEDFSKAIVLLPNNADIFHNRAYCLRQMNLFEKAVKDYTSALTLAPNHFKSLNNRAFCYERLDELELALNDYSSALEIQPDNVSTLVNRAIVLERLERLEEAKDDLDKALKINATASIALSARGKILHKLGLITEAIDDFTAALRINPKDALSLLTSRAISYRALDQYENAIKDYTACIDHDPKFVPAYIHRGFCHRKLENYESSIVDYSAAIRLIPPQACVRLLNNRAYAYVKLGRYEHAVEDYSKAIELQPMNSHAYHNRGVAYDKLGMTNEAYADFSKVLELDSTACENLKDTNSSVVSVDDIETSIDDIESKNVGSTNKTLSSLS